MRTTGSAAEASTRRMDVAIISSRSVTPLSEPLRRLLAGRNGTPAAPLAKTGLRRRAVEWVKDHIFNSIAQSHRGMPGLWLPITANARTVCVHLAFGRIQ